MSDYMDHGASGSFGYDDYINCWIAPDGEVIDVPNHEHWGLSEELDKSWDELYDEGYIRFSCPEVQRTYTGVELHYVTPQSDRALKRLINKVLNKGGQVTLEFQDKVGFYDVVPADLEEKRAMFNALTESKREVASE
jgi:hypothetical protein